MAKTTPAKTNGHKVPALKAAADTKPAVKPAAKKTAAQPAAKPAVKAAVKAAPQSAVKPAPKPAAKTAVKAAALKPAPKPAAKPVAKPVVKAASKPSVKAAPKAQAKPDVKAVDNALEAAAAPLDAGREKVRKQKLVRDSFTMPELEYAVLGQVKKACLKAGFEIKKSELLRIGVALISQLDMATLQKVLASLPQLKTGRPKND
jgi:hypothetical protein